MLIVKNNVSCLTTLLVAALRDVCPITKSPTPQVGRPTNPAKSAHAHFSLINLFIRTSAGISVDLLSSGSVKKFTCASFFTNISNHLNISKITSL